MGCRASVAEGAPVFLDERVIGLVAAEEGGPSDRFVPIDGIAALLQSEALAALR